MRGRYAIIFAKITISDLLIEIFMEIYAIMPSLKGIGVKNRNSGGFSLGNEVPKNHFWTKVAKFAAQSRIILILVRIH